MRSPRKHRPAGLGELERLVVALDRQHPLREELADHPAPLALGQLGADAEHAQLVVAELLDLRRALPEQDVDDLPGAEPLVPLAVQPEHRGEQLLRGDRAVPRLGRRQAGVAVAAGRRVLAEVGEQLHPAALDRLAQRQHRVEVLREPAPVVPVAGRVVDHLALLHDVGEAVGEPGGGGQAVATRPARLLVVALDRLRQVEVGDEPDVGLVDAHAEGDRRDHDDAVLAQEARLVRGAGRAVEPGVVRQRRDALRGEELGGLLDRLAREAVDDARVARVLGAQQLEELAARLVLRARCGR